MRALAVIARRYNGGRARTTVAQNIVLRWISQSDLPALYTDLVAAGLGQAGASTLADITACPGRIRANWASPPLGVWQLNCASASSRGMARSMSR